MSNWIKNLLGILSITVAVSINAQGVLNHKIIYVISPPRSLSVAFLRSMYERGDFQVISEPFHRIYCFRHYYEITKDWFKQDAPHSLEEIRKKIFQMSERSHVFVRERATDIRESLFEKEFIEGFVKNKQVQFVLLLRNVHSSLISLYKKLEGPWSTLEKTLSSLMGYQACYELFDYIKKEGANYPLLVNAEDLYENPTKTLQLFCDSIGIPFKQESLHWKSLGDDFFGEEWNEFIHKEVVHRWHDEAIKSTSFFIPETYECDEKGQPTFAEITNEVHRKVCKQAYEENIQYYNLLKS